MSSPLKPIANLVAVDIGNSQIKLGKFTAGEADPRRGAYAQRSLPEPFATLALPVGHGTPALDLEALAKWSEAAVCPDARWFVGSVHRGTCDALTTAISTLAKKRGVTWQVRRLNYQDLPITANVDQPDRVGVDRLIAAVAADHLREPGRPAIVVDLGTAITVDLVTEDGSFAGGAILPGIGTAARALAEQTDALPLVDRQHLAEPPAALGKSTVAAIEAGLYWGAVGAIRELAGRLSAEVNTRPELFLTGGASADVAALLTREGTTVRHVPHLVLSGIAIVAGHHPGQSGK
jgi:type III pantothenate kinase